MLAHGTAHEVTVLSLATDAYNNCIPSRIRTRDETGDRQVDCLKFGDECACRMQPAEPVLQDHHIRYVTYGYRTTYALNLQY